MPVTDQAFVTLGTNDVYCHGALVLGQSLRNHRTSRRLAVLITPQVSSAMRSALSSIFDEVVDVNEIDSGDSVHLALLKRLELGVTFTKLHCWTLTQYSKCVFMDADTLVLCNIDELFDREEFSAAPDSGWPDCFNSGVFVFQPSLKTYNLLLQFASEHGSFDGGDQGLLNSFFSSWATTDIGKHLPFIYNLSSSAVYSYAPAFQYFGKDAKVVHFLGPAKPWNYKYNPQARTVIEDGSASIPQCQLSFLELWWMTYSSSILPLLEKLQEKLSSKSEIQREEVWLSAYNIDVERIQSSFLYKIFGLPHCVPYAALCLEAGQHRLQFLVWFRFFKFWFRVCFLAERVPFFKDILTDSSHCLGYNLFIKKIHSVGLSMDLLGSVTLTSAIRIALYRLIDIERQEVFAAAAKSCSPLYLQLPCTLSKTSQYLFLIDNPQARRALTLARCNILPSSLMDYRFDRSSKSQGRCPCNSTDIECLPHALLHCSWYNDLRQDILNPLLANLQGKPDAEIILVLLSSVDKWSINRLAHFLYLIIQRRAFMVTNLLNSN